MLSEEWDQTREQLKSDIPDKDRSLSRELEAFWQFQNIAESRLEDELGGDYLESQLFIPAGRAFFTSLGKSYALLEQGSALDPVTAQFGRLYSRIRDQRLPYLYNESSRKKIDSSPSENLMTEFFGGTIKLAKNEEYIESSDGRKVPFSALSSGQQELMPLWLATRWLLRNQTTNDLIYVEEPEAHLFPSAQESLTRYLASFVAQPEGNRRLFLTTHSPYVLAGLNNLLKAGELSAKLPEEQLIKLSSVVSMDVWLKPGAVKAYAIRDKVAFSIIDEDGFIDTNYLDEISNDVANTYSSLLDLEYEK